MYFDKTAILSRLTQEDIIRILNRLGCHDYKIDSKGVISFSTKYCHGGDSPYKLCYYPHKPEDTQYKYGMVHCYTCGDTYSLIELVIRAFRNKGIIVTWYWALSWIVGAADRLRGTYKLPPSSEPTKSWEWINRLIPKEDRPVQVLPEISEQYLKLFTYYPFEDWLNEGITAEVMSEFEIGYYARDNAITIPHRDINGRLVGIRERRLDEEEAKLYGKYVPISIEGKILSHPLGQNFYGAYVNKERIRKADKILLVESEKSVLQCNSYFGDDSFAVAVCGSNISPEQVTMLLKEFRIGEVILGFDREYKDPDSFEALSYRNKLIKKVKPLVPYCRVCLLFDQKDRLGFKDSPTDKGKDVLLELLDEKIPVTKRDLEQLRTSA